MRSGARSRATAPDPRDPHSHRRVRHLFAACDLGEDKLYGLIKPRKTRTRFLEFRRYLRTLCLLSTRVVAGADLKVVIQTMDAILPGQPADWPGRAGRMGR